MSPAAVDWSAANQRLLVAELARVRGQLDGKRRDAGGRAPATSSPSALEHVVAAFDLTPFERDVLLLCAGVELDGAFADAVREAAGEREHPTFRLALALLGDAHWSATAPTAPLRHWRLVELASGSGLVDAPLRIDERVLHHLAGLSYPDERLHGLSERWEAPDELPATHDAAAERVAALLADAGGRHPVQLCGADDGGIRDVAATACAQRGLALQVLGAGDLPGVAAERTLLARLWEREAALTSSGLLLVVDDRDGPETLQAAAAFATAARCTLLVAGREPLRIPGRTLPRQDVRKPDGREQERVWRRALGPGAEQLNGQIERLVNQFDMGRPAIVAASREVLRSAGDDPELLSARLWDTCRAQSRSQLDDLAQRVRTPATWHDLVLAPAQTEILHDIVTHVRRRGRVYGDWGFAAMSSRGLGISALFAGTSGTGKTLAAEILANELELDLYRIDLSQVVSKYIGETEKNLRRVFDAAETAGAVLLFDEADALFGKRSEVKDSHDRYANIEVSYLLQRMEAYRGLAILTTNMQKALDPAFTRRIRFIVQFPFPEVRERAEIWRRVFPPATPTEGLEVERLARLNVTGGNIRNIALGAAFLAADDAHSVQMSHVLRAARAEYAKLDRPLTDAEIAGWA